MRGPYRLRRRMRAPRPQLLLALLALCGTIALAGCGQDKDRRHVEEGVPVRVDGLEYKVVISRFMNANLRDDRAYLGTLPPAPADKLYLGVFFQIKNVGDEPKVPSGDMYVIDTRGFEYQPLRERTEWTLPLSSLEPKDHLPRPNTPAASGPIQGSMQLFLVDVQSNENRPLELKIPVPSGEEPASIELDI